MFPFDRQRVKYKSAVMLAALAGDTIGPPLFFWLTEFAMDMSLLGEVAGWQLCCHPPTHPQAHIHLRLSSQTSSSWSVHVSLLAWRATLLFCLYAFEVLHHVSFLKHSFAVCFEQFCFSPSLFTCMQKKDTFLLSHFCRQAKGRKKGALFSAILTFSILKNLLAWWLKSQNPEIHKVILPFCFVLALDLCSLCWFSIYSRVFSNSLSP